MAPVKSPAGRSGIPLVGPLVLATVAAIGALHHGAVTRS